MNKKSIRELVRDKKGANLVEYIMLVALIAVVVMAAVTTFKDAVDKQFTDKAGIISGM